MIEFSDLQTTVMVVLALCGGVSLVGGALKLVAEFTKPNRDLKARVNEHDKLLANDDARLKRLEEASRIELRALMTLIGHELDPSNHTSQLRASEQEINDWLISK
jgi:hypothetical protein